MNKDWEIKKLGEVCNFVRGPFGGSLKKNIFKTDGFAVYEQQHAIYDQFDKIRYFIDEKKFNEMKRFEVNPGDLIMSCSGTMGKIAIVPKNIRKGIINQALLKLRPTKNLLGVFLKLWMQSERFQDSLKEYSGGAAIQNVASVAILKQIEIQLPVLIEQKRIVSILDKAFVAIDKAKANAEQNLKNAKGLFDSFCNRILWEQIKTYSQKQLSDIVDGERGGIKIGPFGSALKIGELVDKGNVRVLYIENIVNNHFDWKKEKYITTKKFIDLKNYEVFSGDVLITIMGTIGRTAIVPKHLGKSIISSHLIKITPNQNLISSEFLNYSLNKNPFVVKQLFGQAKGAIMKGINSTIIKNLNIPLPPLKIQKNIVQKLDILSTETKKLEEIYKKKIADFEELKKSILQKAFSGEL